MGRRPKTHRQEIEYFKDQFAMDRPSKQRRLRETVISAHNSHKDQNGDIYSMEEIGYALGVTRQTIANWEDGISIPNIIQLSEILTLFHADKLRAFQTILSPDRDDSVYDGDKKFSAEELKEQITYHVNNVLDEKSLRNLYYILNEEHGGDMKAFLELCVAYLQCTFLSRQVMARTVCNHYETAKELDSITNPEDVQPDLKMIKNASKAAMEAVKQGQSSYTL